MSFNGKFKYECHDCGNILSWPLWPLAKIMSWKFSAGMWGFFPPFKCSNVLSVSISSGRHISSLSRETWYVVNIKPCRTDDIAVFSCLFIPSLGLQSKPLVLIITLLKPFHSGDEHPLQTVNKQVGYFHEASSQRLIAPQNWSLPTVNSNYCTHGFLCLSYI